VIFSECRPISHGFLYTSDLDRKSSWKRKSSLILFDDQAFSLNFSISKPFLSFFLLLFYNMRNEAGRVFAFLSTIYLDQKHGKTNCGRLTWLCYMCYNPGWNLWMVGLSIQQHMKWTLVSWPGPNCRKKSFLYLVFEFCFSPFPGNTVRLHSTIISENANVHQFVTPPIASIWIGKDYFSLSK